jgi:predicted aspartyl protease
MTGVFPAGAAMEVAVRRSKCVCVTVMAATGQVIAPRLNLRIVQIAGCFVRNMPVIIIADRIILRD